MSEKSKGLITAPFKASDGGKLLLSIKPEFVSFTNTPEKGGGNTISIEFDVNNVCVCDKDAVRGKRVDGSTAMMEIYAALDHNRFCNCASYSNGEGMVYNLVNVSTITLTCAESSTSIWTITMTGTMDYSENITNLPNFEVMNADTFFKLTGESNFDALVNEIPRREVLVMGEIKYASNMSSPPIVRWVIGYIGFLEDPDNDTVVMGIRPADFIDKILHEFKNPLNFSRHAKSTIEVDPTKLWLIGHNQH